MRGSPAIRLTRSVLFAPGNHTRRAEKALGSDAVLAVLDLEDAVPTAEKAAARTMIAAALKYSRKARAYVRINALSSADWEADLETVVCPNLDGIVLPKVETVAELRELDRKSVV